MAVLLRQLVSPPSTGGRVMLRLVRHGDGLVGGALHTGRTDVGLNDVGRRQAAALSGIATGPYGRSGVLIWDAVWRPPD